MVSEDGVQRHVVRRFTDPEAHGQWRSLSEAEREAALSRARSWASARASEDSALPIEAQVHLAGRLSRNDDGSWRVNASFGNKITAFSGTLDEMTVRAPLQAPAVFVRPVVPFDLGRLAPQGAAAERLNALAQGRQGVMVVAKLTVENIEIEGILARAGGRIDAISLHEVTAVDRRPVPGDMIWSVPKSDRSEQITAADIDRAFRLRREDGVFLDDREADQSNLTRLLAWHELTRLPVDEVLDRRLSPDLFWFALDDIAPEALSESLVAPYLRDPRSGRFAPGVDVIERRELEDAALRALWPAIAAALPETPLPVRVIETVPASDYDLDRGGFAVTFRSSGWLLGGRYPILAGLPDFLPVPRDEAQVLLDRMNQIDGPGRRALSVQARVDITSRRATFPEEGPLTEPRVVVGYDLNSASLHVGARHSDQASLDVNRIADLDPVRFAGPVQPLASLAELDRWAARADDPGARGEDLIAAAISVADDPGMLAQAMNRTGISDPLGTAQTLPLPEPLVLTGRMTLAEQADGWSVTEYRWSVRSNDSGLQAPQVALADRAILTDVALGPDMARALRGIGGRLQYRAEATPVTAGLDGQRPTLYLRLDRVAFFSIQTDETGLPLVRGVLQAEPAPEAAPPAAPDALIDAPELVVVDHDLLDLLHLREAPETVDDATLDRMLLDRLLREIATPEADLVWGRFFDPVPQRLNRVERAALLPAFRVWQTARAAAIPDRVVARVATNAIQAGCRVMAYAGPGQANQFSDGVRAVLEGRDYAARRTANGATLGMLEKMARDVPDRMPLLAGERLTQIGGRPIYAALGAQRHPTASPCVGRTRLDAVTDGFEAMRSGSMDAVVVLRDAILLPRERRTIAETRHIARLAEIDMIPGTGRGPGKAGTLVLTLDVTDAIFVASNPAALPNQSAATGEATRLSVEQIRALRVAPPTVADITGLTLASPAEAIDAALPGAARIDHPLHREIGPKAVPGRGTLRATEAGTMVALRIDTEAGQVLASLEDERVDTARLALGRAALYDPARVTAEGVLGALLKKYGEPSLARDDRRGGVPLKRLVWGYDPRVSLPHCLPAFDLGATRALQDAIVIRTESDRAVHDLARRLPWPLFETMTETGPDWSACGPVVVAEVSRSGGSLALTTWAIDPSSLSDVDLTPRPAPSTETLIENSADIDL
ncbi:hypothetical protein [Roseovarius sp. D22-M7]|uniref:hypothetical protein n=1 Tax=Roseovarius sp. D22-M7 TaxID=3127116 RepID=UPI0030102F90